MIHFHLIASHLAPMPGLGSHELEVCAMSGSESRERIRRKMSSLKILHRKEMVSNVVSFELSQFSL